MEEEKVIIEPIRDLEEADKKRLVVFAGVLAERRRDFEIVKAEKVAAAKLLAETPEAKSLQESIDDLASEQEGLTEAEDQLRTAVLKVYKETKEKEPIDKVKVKIFTNLEYDDAEVLEWCREKATTLLIVNKKLFEKTAVAIGAPVTEEDDPKCTIAKDLSIYLDSAIETAEVSEGGK